MCRKYYSLMHFHFTAGTQTAMKNITLAGAGPKFITVKWNLKYTPISLEHFTQCFSMCDMEKYFSKLSFLPVETDSLTIANLKPGSICEMRLLAVFNPAMLDIGMEHVFWTHPSGMYRV